MQDLTDKELIDELASRHAELIVIRPKASNARNMANRLVVFAKTKTDQNGYDIFEAMELLHDATVGLLKDSLTTCGD